MELKRPEGRIAYVIKKDCTSCRQCIEELPEVFAFDEKDLSEVHNPYAAVEEQIQSVIESCQGKCIHWRD